MRIGARVTETSISGVYLRADGGSGSRCIEVGPDGLVAAFDRLLLELLEHADRIGGPAETVSSVSFDASAVLVPLADEPVTAIRIAPRPPADRAHELRGGGDGYADPQVVHLAGGHTTLGDELAPLDTARLREAAAAAPRRGRYVVTSVGSLIDPAHELEAGRILLELADPASVDYSHSFNSSSFAIRERTAIINSLLIPVAESLVTSLALVVGARLPGARLYASTNDGGCVPLTRLSVLPVHSMLSARASEFIGAAALLGTEDGRIVVAGGDEILVGEIIEGAPAVRQKFQERLGSALATKVAHLTPLTGDAVHPFPGSPVVHAVDAPESGLPANILSNAPVLAAEVDLCAFGAACAQLSDWAHRIVRVTGPDEMRHELEVAEARVRARLVSFGASPSAVRIVESRTVGTAYQNPSLVSVRVRGTAGQSIGTLLSGGDGHAAQR